MKIWTHLGETEVLLCDHGYEGPSGFLPQTVRTKQVRSFLRGAHSEVSARNNSLRIWSFATARIFASMTAAQIYVIRLHDTVPEQATVYVEMEDHATVVELPNCMIEYQPQRLLGACATVAWTLTFGALALPPGIDASGAAMFDADGEEMIFQQF